MSEYLFGYHTIEETLKKGKLRATLLLSRRNERIDAIRRLAEDSGIPVSEVEEGELSRLSGSTAHKGAVLVMDSPPKSSDLKGRLAALHSETALALVLDHITDPQNLGAVLRSADQFRVDFVLVPSRRSAQDTQTVAKVSSGASAYAPLFVVPNIPSALELLKKHEFWIFGADLSGTLLNKMDFRGRACLVLGSEGEGLGRLTRERCDLLVRIPSAGHVDSFNVSAAAAILMYEARRQQGFPF